MRSLLGRYTHWLHTRWPAGVVENLPEADGRGRTNIPGAYIVGDLTGIPLLKFSSDSGSRAIRDILADGSFAGGRRDGALDVAIIGAGVSGISAAIEAKKAGLSFAVYEASQVFSTVANFPKGKPIYTYPTEMHLDGGLQFEADVKEALLAEMEQQRRDAGVEITDARIERIAGKTNAFTLHHAGGETSQARRVIVAIGRSGNFRKLGVPGEDRDKVYNRLHDPKDFCGQDVLVVGGGDSALEIAIALGACGSNVTLSYRKKEFARPKPENVEKINALAADPNADVEIERPSSERASAAMTDALRDRAHPGSVQLMMGSAVREIGEDSVKLTDAGGQEVELPNDAVFAMIGREAPLDFFRRSGLNIRGEWRAATWLGFAAFFAFAWFIYLWKGGTSLNALFKKQQWFPFNVPAWLDGLGSDPATLLGVVAANLSQPGFYYSLAYCLCIVVFGWRRIQRRRTPYVTAQTWTLAAFQVVPLFLLPYLLLPWMGHNGWFDQGPIGWVADQLIPVPSYGGEREYWRAFGLILAWPLFIWNVFSEQPLWGWLAVSFVQTFVLIPLIVWRWGKGAYCGWVCSCGALAETMGDAHRQKMPHGPLWNRVNMTGQVLLGVCFLLLGLRVASWASPDSAFGKKTAELYGGLLSGWSVLGVELNYYHAVDIFLAGVVGVGLYFWFSGRVWCRFACPLAALMHIYARFSRYRIFAEKKKCISCNVCTSVCHQGIDVMSFANKGQPMEDPQCVRCSACVQQCPTGVLAFGRFDGEGRIVLDRVPASPVRMRERARQ